MIDPKKIEQIARQITASIPAGVREAADNIELKVKQAVQSQLGKLDVVTREEMDIQQELVMRLRKRVEELEDRLDALDGKSNQE
ncbi:ubiquinone biosynthesis accessory factor UbiK [Aliidiomarina haloalkalitolerans]|uniref:ubiquinone biosynthesis accessory factor UbiK n=1 Tax=Aliidiomarina haloalkalitolerans TaxID=859059 RepID=UPI0018E54931|nr:accessory factor UbiK family protein [Aliidiomarina haloalkalitolerans]MCL4410882.1 accessory factor UbiK family protein [Gammaproteobacteria bacterium]